MAFRTSLQRNLIYECRKHKILVIAPLRVAKTTWCAEINKWDHLKDLKYSIVVGTPTERKNALQRRADIYIINRENIPWLIEYTGAAFDFDMDFDTPEEKEQAKEAYIRAFYEREAKFHIEFERIHPFEDGNGRTGRIITNAHLLHNNLAPIIITSSMKNIYLNCISNRDYQTLGNLFRMLASVTTSQLIAYYRKVKGISPDDIGGKRGKPNK